MRTSDEKIKEAILHPEEEVRLAALRYYSGAYSQDPSVMPLVVRAVEKFGKKGAFAMLREAEELPQTEATLRWLEDQLRGGLDPADVVDDNHRWAVALLLCAADPGQLLAGHADAVRLPLFPERLAAHFERRLEMHGWDWARGWEALAQRGRESLDRGAAAVEDLDYFEALVESLARFPREGAASVLGVAAGSPDVWDHRLRYWLGPHVVTLAGRMGLAEAVPSLVEKLRGDDRDLADAAVYALVRLGGDEVVRAVVEGWARGSADYRGAAAVVLDYVHTDLAAAESVRLLTAADWQEEDLDVLLGLGHAATAHFREQAIDPVRRLVAFDDFEPDDADVIDLRHRLVAAATVMGATFPEYDEWYRQAVADRWGWEECEPGRLAAAIERFGVASGGFHRTTDAGETGDPHAWDEDEPDDETWDEEYEDDELSEDFPDDEPPAATRRAAPGRNDPCPCGSGKKYKKCCLRKGWPL